MTALKTPEQIADAYFLNHSDAQHENTEERKVQIKRYIAEAIEADRAQRAEIHQDWRDDQENVRGADHIDVAWTACRADGGIIFQSDMTLTSAEAVGMFQGIGEANR